MHFVTPIQWGNWKYACHVNCHCPESVQARGQRVKMFSAALQVLQESLMRACQSAEIQRCWKTGRRASPRRAVRHFFANIPQLNVSRGETHYETLPSLWVWIKNVTGACASVFKCALLILKECPQSTQSSVTASKPQCKYHLSRAAILRGHASEQIPTSHVHFTSPFQLVCHPPRQLERQENYTPSAEIWLIARGSCVPKCEKAYLFSSKRSRGSVSLSTRRCETGY